MSRQRTKLTKQIEDVAQAFKSSETVRAWVSHGLDILSRRNRSLVAVQGKQAAQSDVPRFELCIGQADSDARERRKKGRIGYGPKRSSARLGRGCPKWKPWRSWQIRIKANCWESSKAAIDELVRGSRLIEFLVGRHVTNSDREEIR
jgi:hypothetical protein